MGGGFALLAASSGSRAAAPYYGPVPAESALDGACPVVASYGGRDRPLAGAATRLQTALSARGIVHDVKEYPTAAHGFANRLLPGPLNRIGCVIGFGYDTTPPRTRGPGFWPSSPNTCAVPRPEPFGARRGIRW